MKSQVSAVGAKRIRWPEGSSTMASAKDPKGDRCQRPTTARSPDSVPSPAMWPSKIHPLPMPPAYLPREPGPPPVTGSARGTCPPESASNGQGATMPDPGRKEWACPPGERACPFVVCGFVVCGACYEVVTEVSSTKKYVLSEESSTPRKRSVTVLPLNEDRSSVFST